MVPKFLSSCDEIAPGHECSVLVMYGLSFPEAHGILVLQAVTEPASPALERKVGF